MDERFLLVIAISSAGWLFSIGNHRHARLRCKMRIHRAIAVVAGSRTEWVDGQSFAFQVGWLSLPLWCLLLGFSNFGICVLFDGLATIFLRKALCLYAKKTHKDCDR
jgi:hypothetical protein